MDTEDIWAVYKDAKLLLEETDESVTDKTGRSGSCSNIDTITGRITNTSNRDTCVACGAIFDNESVYEGFLVCTNCGRVKEAFIDSSAEWRCFNTANGKDISSVRCGEAANTLLPGTQLNTFIGGKDKRLQRVHQWSNLTRDEKNLHEIYKRFEQIGTANNLSKSIICTASELYSKLYNEMERQNLGVKRCNVRQGLIAACLFCACKQLNAAREKKEIADMLGNTTKIATKGWNKFLDIMGDEYRRMPPLKPEDFVDRFSRYVEVPYQYQYKLSEVVRYVSALDVFADNTPTSVTCACIYFISVEYDLKITKEDIHKHCKSSNIIITKTYQKILTFKPEILALLKTL